MNIPILYEDNHLIVVNKPAGWVVQGASSHHASLLDWVATYLKHKYQKPGNVFVGVVSRLDQPVSGVVPFARTSKGASRLNEQIRDRSVQKKYWALVEGTPSAVSLRLSHWLRRREEDTKTIAYDTRQPETQEAVLTYRVESHWDGGSWMEIDLETGRKHQIRAQLAHIGHPIVGDRLYGSKRSFPDGIALHCSRFACQHPTLQTPLLWQAFPPNSWKSFLHSHAGNDAWDQLQNRFA
ncbi:MAG: RluA family pseudouridine synthase [Pirellulales bacterium]